MEMISVPPQNSMSFSDPEHTVKELPAPKGCTLGQSVTGLAPFTMAFPQTMQIVLELFVGESTIWYPQH